MMKKVLCIILCIIIASSVLIACSDNGGDESKDAKSEAVSETVQSQAESKEASEEVSVDEFEDGLPDKNFGGRDFTILQRTEYKYEFTEDDQSIDKINSLISERNHLVEQRFGVKINTIEQDGAWGKHEDFLTYMRNTIDGGLADYDLVAGYAAITPSVVGEGLFINWYELDEWINFEKRWWSQDFIDELTINNQLYMLSGDISLTLWESMQCMFFNKDIAANCGAGDLYQVVRDGDWTFDKMYTIIKSAYNDTQDEDSKIYGYATARTTQIDVYQDAFDIPVTTKDPNGKPYFTVNQEKTYSALDMLFELIVESPYTKICADQIDTMRFFGKGTTLFAPLFLSNGTALQEYDVNYGILPMPKFNKEQEDYHSTNSDFYSVFAIPNTAANDLEFIGIITEALCVESARSVVPEYYNIVLKERSTSDEDSIEMIDRVRSGLLCNFGYLYSYALNWPAHQLNICINDGNKSFASNWESKEDGFIKNLEEEMTFYFGK